LDIAMGDRHSGTANSPAVLGARLHVIGMLFFDG
jgi:hypothetical protein